MKTTVSSQPEVVARFQLPCGLSTACLVFSGRLVRSGLLGDSECGNEGV